MVVVARGGGDLSFERLSAGYFRNFDPRDTSPYAWRPARRLLTMQAPDEIQAMFGTPGEPVPTVAAKDIRACWKLGRNVIARSGRKPGQVAIGIELLQHVCSPGADVRAVSFRCMRFQMLDMLQGNLLSGWLARPLREIAFLIVAKVPMKWWAIGVPRRGLF